MDGGRYNFLLPFGVGFRHPLPFQLSSARCRDGGLCTGLCWVLSGPALARSCGEQDQVQGDTESNVVNTETAANLWHRESGMALHRCSELRPGARHLSLCPCGPLDIGCPGNGIKPWVRQLPQAEAIAEHSSSCEPCSSTPSSWGRCGELTPASTTRLPWERSMQGNVPLAGFSKNPALLYVLIDSPQPTPHKS